MRLCFALAFLALFASYAHAEDEPFMRVHSITSAPLGWEGFCYENPNDCRLPVVEATAFTITSEIGRLIEQVNRWVNENVRPLSDLEHWGVTEKWSYPDDGYGDCEDYAILKKRMLQTLLGIPAQDLYLVVVQDQRGAGHAVLGLRAMNGDFILDNFYEDIVPWYVARERGYIFTKRQSRQNPNVWLKLR